MHAKFIIVGVFRRTLDLALHNETKKSAWFGFLSRVDFENYP